MLICGCAWDFPILLIAFNNRIVYYSAYGKKLSLCAIGQGKNQGNHAKIINVANLDSTRPTLGYMFLCVPKKGHKIVVQM